MKNLTKNNWIPVCVSLPDTHRVVIVQVADLPDPTIASYWPETGKWVCEEIGYEEVNNEDGFNVLAWRDYPESYVEAPVEYIFRTADEARTMTFNSKKRIASGNSNAEFYDAREKVLQATIHGEWNCYFEELSPRIVEAFQRAGFNTIKEKRGYTIDWKQEKSNS